MPRAVVLTCLLVTACGARAQPAPTATDGAYQRFLPVPTDSNRGPWAATLALDTKTGTLCRTMKDNGAFIGAFEGLNALPVCSDLYGRHELYDQYRDSRK